jgi:hypothetical protein
LRHFRKRLPGLDPKVRSGKAHARLSDSENSRLRHSGASACAIKRGEAQRLLLGNIDIARDWGAAPEYVDAMWRIVQLDNPD